MIEVFDLLDNRIGIVKKYSDLHTPQTLDSWSELSFNAPCTSQHNKLLQNEMRLKYDGELFVIKDIRPNRDNSGSPIIEVTAPSIAIDLNHKPRQVVGAWIGAEGYSNWSPNTQYSLLDRVKYYGVVYECRLAHLSGSQLSGTQWGYWTTCNLQLELAELVLPATDMMNLALVDTGWTVGIVDDDGASRTFSGEWVSVPTLLQEMAEKYDKHLVYHGDTKVIDLVDEPGLDLDVTIEYGKNLTGINKAADSTDFITKLFVYGDEELTFNIVNLHGTGEHPLYQLQNEQSFILNFNYFLSQGYTEDAIYQNILSYGDGSPFIRIGELKLADYVDEAILLSEAVKQLAEELSTPKVSYKANFVMLAQVLSGYNETIGLGDWVKVRDLDLGVDVKVRITNLDIYPGFPEKSSADLSNKEEFFGNAVASSVEYNEHLAKSPAIANLMKNYINTYTTVINSGRGDLVWKDGQLTSIDLDVNGNPTGNQVRLTPTGLGVSTDFGVTYANAITGLGVLANKVIADSIHVLSIGAAGITIEPQDCGVSLNNTEGIIVQSEDKRFKTTMKATNEMGGTAYGFGIWNGDFDENEEYTGDSLVFGVNMNGDGYFKGEIDALAGKFRGAVYASSFYIDEVNIKDTFLSVNAGNLKIGNITFNGTTGDITTSGNINLGGNITWGVGASPTKVIYIQSVAAPTTPTSVYTAYPSTGTTAWHQTFNTSDNWMSFSYNGGLVNSWTAPMKCQGKDGTDGTTAAVTRASIVAAMLDATSDDGIYSYNVGGVNCIGIRATAISAQVANIQDLNVGSYLRLFNGTGDNGQSSTNVGLITTRENKSLVLESAANIRISPINGLYLDINVGSIYVKVGAGVYSSLDTWTGTKISDMLVFQ